MTQHPVLVVDPSFEKRKLHILETIASSVSDRSPKGSIDERIFDLVSFINQQSDYFTTSSCSGRIAIYSELSLSPPRNKKKKGGCWILSSHDPLSLPERNSSSSRCWLQSLFPDGVDLNEEHELSSIEEDFGECPLVYTKFEPMILHVQCRTLVAARTLLHHAIQSGFRNSGIVISNKHQYTVAVRCSWKLDAPIAIPVVESNEGKVVPRLIVSKDYLLGILELANKKLQENFSLTNRFFQCLKEHFNKEIIN